MIGQTINNYTIVSLIGEGGMGSVYLARHKYLDIESAIKVLHPHYSKNQEIKDRFINEGIVLSKLDSPFIVKIKDFFDNGEYLFLVMEYIKGIALDHYLSNVFGPIPELRAIEIFKKILLGVHSAHLKGVIHRDLKPSNIILESDDTPKILDFGIAKLLDSNYKATSPGTRMGSVIYMSPEQILGKEIDIRTDIYSLGLTLFEMLTARNPYDQESGSEYSIHSKIVNEPLPLPSLYYPNISSQTEYLISKAVAKNPNDRFGNCDDFIEALNNLSFEYREIISVSNVVNEFTEVKKEEKGYKTSDELLKEVDKKTKIRQDIQLTDKLVRKKKTNNNYILLGTFVFLLLVVGIIYLIKSNDNSEIKPDVKKENTSPIQKPIDTKPQEQPKKESTTIDNSKQSSDDKESTDKQKRKSTPKPKKNYERETNSQNTQKGHTTFK